MLRWLLRRKLDAEERKLGESMDYLRHIVDESPASFLRFASIMPFVNSRKVLPKQAWFAAQITTLRHEDCGPCLQIAVNLAKQHGVGTELIRAILDKDATILTQEMTEVCDFTMSILSCSDDSTLREALRARYGERGLIELAYAISSSRIPPTVKRVLGYATSCSKVTIHT